MLQLHLGVALLGFSGLFAKLIDLPALDIIAYRSLFTVALLFFILKLSRTPVLLRNAKDYTVATILGLLAGIHWVTYFVSIQKTSVAVGMITLFTYPVITVLIEPLIRKQLPNLKDIIISAIVLLAVSFLFPSIWMEGIEMSHDYLVGVILGLTSAVMFALRNIGIQHYFHHYKGTQGMFYQFLVSAVILLPFIDTAVADLNSEHIEKLLILTVFFSAAPHVLFANSISQISAKTAGLVACLQPLYGIALSFVLLSEVPQVLTLIGGAIIICAALYETSQAGKRNKSK